MLSGSLLAQTAPFGVPSLRPPDGIEGNPGENGVGYAPPPPVIINGKRDREMGWDERRDFLASKSRTIFMEDGKSDIIRVTPGFPVKLRFQAAVTDALPGDKGMITVQKKGKVLVVSANRNVTASTLMTVFGPNNTLYEFQVFVVDSFLEADGTVEVQNVNLKVSEVSYSTNSSSAQSLTRPQLLRIVGNYNALLQEGSPDVRKVKRTAIFKPFPSGFILYDLYQFPGGIAYSFTWKNQTKQVTALAPEHLRLQIGNMGFVPDWVHLSTFFLEPQQTASGLAVLYSPGFNPNQPLVLAWK